MEETTTKGLTHEAADRLFMRRALLLAANGMGRVRPNPLVGCVVVKEGRIISEGYHQEYGHNHAERNALLRPLPADLYRNATLYVNLEPCSHYGKTPPCADLIVERGIRRVVCCNDDPNPLVAGNGFRRLEAAGIEVVRHLLEEEGRELNRRFFTFMEQRRPYVILKWAESTDGFMAPTEAYSCVQPSQACTGGRPYWLSTQAQNRLNHRWRTEEAAILVGSGTFLLDSPSLTARHYLGPQPQPVVLDRRHRLGTQASLPAENAENAKKTGQTGVAGRDACVPAHWMHLHTSTVEETLQALYEAKVQSVIVEGGRQVLDAFIVSGLYDEVRILRSPQTLGSGLPAPEIPPIVLNHLTIIEP